MADPTIETANIEAQTPSASDPFYWTRMQDSQGNTFKAKPENVDALIAEGNSVFNPNQEFRVKTNPFDTEAFTVKASELPQYIRDGYSTTKVDDYRDHLKYLEQLGRPAKAELSPLEYGLGAIASVGSGATYGGSDLIARGLFELEEAVFDRPEGYAKEAAQTLREVYEGMGAGREIAQLIGGILTGGALVGAGKTAAARIGLGAAEGAIGGIGSTAARQALEDPTVTAESYLWNAGIGGALGGFGGLIGEKLAKMGAKYASGKKVTPFDVEPENTIQKLASEGFSEATVPYYDTSGKILGEVTLARNVADAYHPGSKFGVSVENFKLAPDAPQYSEVSILKDLTDRFGSIASPSKLDNLTGETKSLFETLGVTHPTKEGASWFQITSEVLPVEMTGRSFAADSVYKYLKMANKLPREGTADRVALDKVFDPKQGLLREGLLTHMANPDESAARAVKILEDADEYITDYAKASADITKELVDIIPSKFQMQIKQSIKRSLRGQMDDTARELAKRGTNDSSAAAKLLRNVDDALGMIGGEKDKYKVWDLLTIKLKQMDEFIKTRPTSKVTDNDEYAMGALKAMRDKLEKTVFSDAGLSPELASKVNKMRAAKTSLDDALVQFNSRFKTKRAGQLPEIDKQKVSTTYTGDTPGRTLDKYMVVDKVREAFEPFHKSVIDLQEAGLIKNVSLRDSKDVLPILNKFNEFRDYEVIARALNTASGGNVITNAITSAVASSSASLPWLVGAGFLGPAGAILGGVTSSVASAAIQHIGNPTTLLKMIAAGEKADRRFIKLAEALARNASSYASKAVQPLTRVKATQDLGVKPYKDSTGYVRNTRERLEQLNNPDLLKERYSEIPDPVREATIKQTQAALKYALDNMPNPAKTQKISMAEALKTDTMLLAVTNPSAALKRAVLSNDTDSLLHLQNLYPAMMQRFQTTLASQFDGVDTQKLPYQKRMLIQRLLGTNTSGTSKGAAQLSQSAFEENAESESIQPVSSPTMTPGATIQGR